jgi:hypothetical protein
MGHSPPKDCRYRQENPSFLSNLRFIMSQDSSVSLVLGYGLDDRGSNPGRGSEFFSSLPRPDRLWNPPSLLSNGYWGFFPRGQSGWGLKLNTNLHLVPRSKNAWSYTSTPHYVFMLWWLIKHRDNFTFTLLEDSLRSSVIFRSGFPTKILDTFLISLNMLYVPHSSSLV